jgi:hypothetical protein
MRSFIALEHAQEADAAVTVVDWNLGNRCNYQCSYCPLMLHDGSIPWPELSDVTAFCDRAIAHYERLGRTLFFQFSGGEPTLYSGMIDLADHLRGRGNRVGVISNASRTTAWWTRFRDHLDKAVLTCHIEYVDVEHFVAVAGLVSEVVRTHVIVTMVPDRFDECLFNANMIAKLCPNITMTLKPLLVDFGTRMFDYTEGQRRVLLHHRSGEPVRRFGPSARGLMRKVYDDGTTETVKASHLIVRRENRWTGWKCMIGVELLSIDQNGRVFRGICRQGGSIGHFTDRRIVLPAAGVCCEKAVCHCVSDITITKAKYGTFGDGRRSN